MTHIDFAQMNNKSARFTYPSGIQSNTNSKIYSEYDHSFMFRTSRKEKSSQVYWSDNIYITIPNQSPNKSVRFQDPLQVFLIPTRKDTLQRRVCWSDEVNKIDDHQIETKQNRPRLVRFQESLQVYLIPQRNENTILPFTQ